MGKIQEINEENYRQFLMKKDGRTKALKLGAHWCGGCRDLDAVLPKLAKNTPTLDWGRVDTDESKGITKKFKISVIPQILFFRNGLMVGKIDDGFIGYEETLKYIREEVLVKKP